MSNLTSITPPPNPGHGCFHCERDAGCMVSICHRCSDLPLILSEMVQNALRWTDLGNLVDGLSYQEALAVVTHIFGPTSEEVGQVKAYFNIEG